MTVRLLCLDIGDADDALAASAVTRAVALSSSWDRLLFFGRTASVAATLDKQERAEREGVWLDAAASWLLAEDRPVDPPARPQPGPLQASAVAIGRPGLDTGHLAVNERLVELAGSLLVMAVPNDKSVDAIDNAHVWLVGGAPFSVDSDSKPGRIVVHTGGRLTGVVVEGAECALSSWSLQGEVLPPSRFNIGERSRVSVRAS